jgi:simple sugar transport system permease protein
MSTVRQDIPPDETAARPWPGFLQTRAGRFTILAFALLLVGGVIARWTDALELTSSGTFAASMRFAVPIMLAGLGGLYAERSGVINIGLEGMMIAGTWFGAWGGWQFGPWYGVLFGVLGGAIFGLIHAIATVTFAVDHIVSGVAINALALGGMRFLSTVVYDNVPGAGVTQSPRTSPIGTFSVPILSGGEIFGWTSPDFLGWLEHKGWLLISDVGAVLGGLTRGLSWLTLVALLLVPLSWWLLWRTSWGLRLRSCGENPYAAESLGVSVLKMKYYAVIISGGLAGLGGAYLVLVQAGIYREAQTGGRGFIGLAAMLFGNYQPGGVLTGSLLFGFADALRLRQSSAVHGLLLFVFVLLMALALWFFYRRAVTKALITAGFAIAFVIWFALTDVVPPEFIPMTPYIVTLLVLALASQRLRMPAADGIRYRKGESI